MELPPFFKGCDLVVYPISQLFSSGMGLVAMEALAARKPLVTTLIPGNQEFFQDGQNVLLYPWRDHEVLARRIIELYNDRELAERISTNGYNFIQKFDWKNTIASFLKLWRELVIAKR
jgi:glycosyltransferase involved in cell wall biosynthesis